MPANQSIEPRRRISYGEAGGAEQAPIATDETKTASIPPASATMSNNSTKACSKQTSTAALSIAAASKDVKIDKSGFPSASVAGGDYYKEKPVVSQSIGKKYEEESSSSLLDFDHNENASQTVTSYFLSPNTTTMNPGRGNRLTDE